MDTYEIARQVAAKYHAPGPQDIINAIVGQFYGVERAVQTLETAAYEMMRPSVQYRPSLAIDGDHWRALYGENLQDGVAGFGKSPELAMLDFDKSWAEKLKDVPR